MFVFSSSYEGYFANAVWSMWHVVMQGLRKDAPARWEGSKQRSVWFISNSILCVRWSVRFSCYAHLEKRKVQ
jgi:hypothetical protein